MTRNNLLEIRFHGRGGQGAVSAAEILALAAFYDGRRAQAFPSFGVERRGAPVTAFARLADAPIRLREQIYTPDYIVILDGSLLAVDPAWQVGLATARGVLVNATKVLSVAHPRVAFVPATDIAMKEIGKPFVNTAMLGALAAFTACVSLNSLIKAVKESVPAKTVEANLAALRAGYAVGEKK